TGISYFGGGEGGDLAYYPEGAAGPAATFAPAHNTAVVLDTDSVFHGVDRVLGDERALGRVRPGMRLHFDGDGRWTVCDATRSSAPTSRTRSGCRSRGRPTASPTRTREKPGAQTPTTSRSP